MADLNAGSPNHGSTEMVHRNESHVTTITNKKFRDEHG